MDIFSGIKQSIISSLHLTTNFSTYAVEDWNHPRLIKIYIYFWDITLFITTVFFILMLYTIIKKSSKEMGGYKWYLCHQLCWSYAFDLFMSLWKPIPLWPFHLGYSAGIFANFSSNRFYNLPFGILIFTASGMGISIFLSLYHRYIHASPFSTLYAVYSRLWIRFTASGLLFIVIPSILCCPLIIYYQPKKDLQKSAIIQNSNLSYFFEKEPSIFGFDSALSEEWTIIALGGYILTMFCVIILIIIMYFNFLRILYKNKNLLSAGTYLLQKQLFKTLYIQMIFVMVLLVLPLMASFILTIFGIKWVSQFSLYAFMLTSLHSLTDFFVMAYFIKPYRIFIFGMHKIVLEKLFGFKFENNGVIQPLAISTTIVATGEVNQR